METHTEPSAAAQSDVPTPEEIWRILRETTAERLQFQREAEQRRQQDTQEFNERMEKMREKEKNHGS